MVARNINATGEIPIPIFVYGEKSRVMFALIFVGDEIETTIKVQKRLER
jgi:hypothetical protein